MSFNRDAFGQVSGFVDIGSLDQRGMIFEQLEGHDMQHR